MSNCDPWAAVIVSNVVVNCNSSAVFVIYIVINNNSFAVCNFAGTGLKSVTDIILIVIKEVVVHKNLGGPAPVTVGTFDANAARIKWRPKGVVVDDIIVDGDIISSKIYSCSRAIRDIVVAYYDMINSIASANAVAVRGNVPA
jgi:hypothetical protein